jgi:hypothetical protein
VSVVKVALVGLVVVGGGAYALSRYGRQAAYNQLLPFGDNHAANTSESLGVIDSIRAGLRVLTGGNAIGDDSLKIWTA